MNKDRTLLKKWHQSFTPSQNGTSGFSVHSFSETLISKGTLVRVSQLTGATLLAYWFFRLNLWTDDGVRLLAVLAATSALVYLWLALESHSKTQALLNLVAVPILFAAGYAGVSAAVGWLIASFILHGNITALQISACDKEMRGGLFCWSVFNTALAIFLLLG
jgi:hypothetical protein